ncbi:PilW family protein [Aquabacterium sp.]|uniref:PilW family protein n=1 Tax=Aquabacterium sp. TaxID=1872578 RepID=UPI002B8115D3|nr:hypothetical protein [Aquabacterium sp.]HSW07907.1 hypothetical protein [Aquabacterium sp.]
MRTVMPHITRHAIVSRSRGLSIIELLVGIAVGMFVLAGAAMVVTNQITDNRRLLLETQIQQDLRAAMDIISRDVRRSGYWSNAYTMVSPDKTVVQNPYRSAGMDANPVNMITYTYSHDHDLSRVESNAAEADEQSGFKLAADVIQANLGGGNWQALTDPSVVRVTAFTAQINTTTVPLPVCASPPCAPVSAGCGAASALFVRDVVLSITGEAVHDDSVKRSLVSTVRLRNDQVCQ